MRSFQDFSVGQKPSEIENLEKRERNVGNNFKAEESKFIIKASKKSYKQQTVQPHHYMRFYKKDNRAKNRQFPVYRDNDVLDIASAE